MPVKRTQAKASRRLDEFKREALVDGPHSVLLAGLAYHPRYGCFSAMPEDLQAAALVEIEADWRVHGAKLMEWWKQGGDTGGKAPTPYSRPHGPDTLPWAAEKFGIPGETA